MLWKSAPVRVEIALVTRIKTAGIDIIIARVGSDQETKENAIVSATPAEGVMTRERDNETSHPPTMIERTDIVGTETAAGLVRGESTVTLPSRSIAGTVMQTEMMHRPFLIAGDKIS